MVTIWEKEAKSIVLWTEGAKSTCSVDKKKPQIHKVQ